MHNAMMIHICLNEISQMMVKAYILEAHTYISNKKPEFTLWKRLNKL